jgi:hypothetical protein
MQPLWFKCISLLLISRPFGWLGSFWASCCVFCQHVIGGHLGSHRAVDGSHFIAINNS